MIEKQLAVRRLHHKTKKMSLVVPSPRTNGGGHNAVIKWGVRCSLRQSISCL